MQEIAARFRPSRFKPAGRHAPPLAQTITAPATAAVIGYDIRHRVLVKVRDAATALPARLLKGVRCQDLFEADGTGREVLVVFDGGWVDRPIIVGVLESEGKAGAAGMSRLALAEVDERSGHKERVLIEALAELVLKCGAGSITLRKDGKIVLRGTHLLSRASGPIRIKGGHVEIN